MESAEGFATRFLQDYDVDYKKEIDNYTAVETHEVAEAGARKFLEQGGDVESEKDAYGMILDGLRGKELARSEKKVAEFSDKCVGLEGRLTKLHAMLKTKKKVIMEDDVLECLKKLESKGRTISAKDLIHRTQESHAHKKELMLHYCIAWIQGLTDQL